MSLPWRSRRGVLTQGKREILRVAAEECALAYHRGVCAGIALGLLAGIMLSAVVVAVIGR